LASAEEDETAVSAAVNASPVVRVEAAFGAATEEDASSEEGADTAAAACPGVIGAV
jgi:hypothetical protein